ILQGHYAEAGKRRRRQSGVSGGYAGESATGAGALAQDRVPRHAGAWAAIELTWTQNGQPGWPPRRPGRYNTHPASSSAPRTTAATASATPMESATE